MHTTRWFRHVCLVLLIVFGLQSCGKTSVSQKGKPKLAVTEASFFQNEISPDWHLGGDDPNQPEFIFGFIADLAVDRGHNLYVLDTGMKRIQVFSKDHKFIKTIPLPPGFSGGLVQMGDDHIGQLINDVKSRRSYLDVSSVRGVYRGPIELKPPDNTPLPYLPAIAVRRDGILCVSTTDPIPMVQGFDLTRVTGLSTSQPK